MDESAQIRMAMQLQDCELMPGEPLSKDDLKKSKLYYESQPANSDTCGMNALNNLCQRPQFKLKDLQEAEAKHAQAHKMPDHFAHSQPPQDIPTGFFDVEAMKIAAQQSGLEIVDVEPVMDSRKNPCRDFSAEAANSEDGSWFLGFLVYDRRPGCCMHYYALRRDERFSTGTGVWLRLDSQLSGPGEESKNRRLTTDDLWENYQGNSHHFGAWVLRWYPVVYCRGAAEEVCTRLKKESGGACAASADRALRTLKECGWVISDTVSQLLEDVPRTTVRELLVRFARPSEAEMRSALEAADWDLAAAQPAIDKVLRERIALAHGVDHCAAQIALSLCDWEPKQAATLLSLQLQCKLDAQKLDDVLCKPGNPGGHESFPALLHEALQLAGDDVDRAQALLRLLPSVANMSDSKRLLEQTKPTWSVLAAERILKVQKRFSRVSIPVALEVLKRNDEDPHAAGEMLAEYQKGVQRLVLENASTDLLQGDEVLIAETALNSSDWDPSVAFVSAKNLTLAVEQTRRAVRSRAHEQEKVFPVDAVLAALAAGEQSYEAAACFLLGQPLPARSGSAQGYSPQGRPGGTLPQRPVNGHGNQDEEEYCSVM